MKNKQAYSSLALNNNTNQVHAFYTESSGSNDGSVYCNKMFHACYSVIQYDFQLKRKRIIGILYNTFDKRKMYFQMFVPLNINFTIPFLLEYYIYSKTYNGEIVKKILMENKEKKQIVDYCQYLLDQKLSGVTIDYKH